MNGKRHIFSFNRLLTVNTYIARGSITVATADLLFNWFGFDHTSKSVDNSTKAKQLKANKSAVSWYLPLQSTGSFTRRAFDACSCGCCHRDRKFSIFSTALQLHVSNECIIISEFSLAWIFLVCSICFCFFCVNHLITRLRPWDELLSYENLSFCRRHSVSHTT